MEMMMSFFLCFLYIWTLELFLRVEAFPDSGSPKMVVPSIYQPQNVQSCTVKILSANCSSWNSISSQLLELPSECPAPWSKLVLKFSANEKGTQFDRFGALWIGNLEVLRTTTAEPTSTGIEWNLERDITDYREYLSSSSNLYTSLSIPNNVDSTYTGIIEVNVVLTFFKFDSSESEEESYSSMTEVLPLTNAPSDGGSPWNVMTVVGNQSLTYELSSLPTKINEAFVEIYASPHGCEEFYYSNAPSNYASSLGVCGNGVYRELQVYIDGKLAGASYPYPVIYSGGINPFLWRPLAGTMSFAISPRRFDISPFLHVLTDGKSHSLSISVYGNNEDDSGYWFLDAALLTSSLKHSNADVQDVLVSSRLDVFDSNVHETVHTSVMSTVSAEEGRPVTVDVETSGWHAFNASRLMTYSNGSTVVKSTRGNLVMYNDNSFIGTTTGITTQRTIAKISSEIVKTGPSGAEEKHVGVTVDDFPLYVHSYYAENSTSMDIAATVNFTYNRVKSWQHSPDSTVDAALAPSVFAMHWIDAIHSKAAYNRSLDHTVVYVESDTAIDRFQVQTNRQKGSCYDRVVAADGGYFSVDKTLSDDCELPAGLSMCGYDACGSLQYAGYQHESSTDMQVSAELNAFLHDPEFSLLHNRTVLSTLPLLVSPQSENVNMDMHADVLLPAVKTTVQKFDLSAAGGLGLQILNVRNARTAAATAARKYKTR